ncbi:MAG: hypothetical protein QOG04_2195 [Actinomycetota bacterium]|jgi:uncharacterized membrane protein|nr:hypothetical protein [Actinomycetota bacterium]
MGWIIVGAGLLVVVIAWAGMIGKLPRNYFVGIRLPSTLRSDRAWEAGHRAGAPLMMAGGVLLAACGVRILFIGAEAIEGEVWAFVGPMLALFLVATVQAHRAAKAEYKSESSAP